ncbi:MAG: DUF4390 domain-containing protein [Deltaproteobacteria bacterium]|nr:DUF4390 domain-containing protein [Deltaproteobacteria bacterium]MBW2017036.1 DUF4390 domain-containing protein [Deltaproteobacteria bacterium]MBW2129412.1 DUF4390 domain-containing protein [Deltaproteobacteria bacterium]MBW2302941.1 DUF4390 domain-containing protein [Deltaproteobacteria bacterium]
MKKTRTVFKLLAILALLCFFPAPSQAQEARLSDIVLTNTRDHLLVYFAVEGCFTPEMEQAIENGIQTTFTFYIRLYEEKEWAWDRKIIDLEINHTVKYDNIKKVYTIRLAEQGDRTLTVRDWDKAKKLMAEVVALKVIPLKQLQKGRQYKLKMMAQLDRIKLPLYLHHLLFFLSLWDFETDWHEIDFQY